MEFEQCAIMSVLAVVTFYYIYIYMQENYYIVLSVNIRTYSQCSAPAFGPQ